MSDTAVVEILLKGKDELSGTVGRATRSLEGLHSSLSRIKDIALGNILGNLGVSGLEEAVRGVVEFGKSMVDANAEIETMRLRLNILYGNAAEGAQAFAFLKQNELTKPFDIQSILDASTRLVAFKQDITTLLPAIENIAGALGQPLMRVSQAFDSALAGRFAMLKNIGISKDEIAAAGAQFDAHGHLTDPSSLARAFIELSNTTFKDGADKLSQTWSGLMSSMSSQWFYFKANLGQGAFAVLEQQLHGIVHTLQDPNNSAAIQQFETGLGAGLARATVAAINFAQTVGPYLGSGIALITRLWPLVSQGAQAAFGVVGSAVSTFGNWLTGTAFPVLQKAINAIGGAWQAMYPVVQEALNNIGTFLTNFFGYIKDNAGPLFQGLAGAFKIGLGAAQAVFGAGLNLLSGNWANFQNDFNTGANLIMTGAVQMVGGLSQAMVPLAAKLFVPWTDLARWVRQVWFDIGAFTANGVGTTVDAFTNLGQDIVAIFQWVIGQVVGLFQGLPNLMSDPLARLGAHFTTLGTSMVQAIQGGLAGVLGKLGDFFSALGSIGGKIGSWLGLGGSSGDIKKLHDAAQQFATAQGPPIPVAGPSEPRYVPWDFVGPLPPGAIRLPKPQFPSGQGPVLPPPQFPGGQGPRAPGQKTPGDILADEIKGWFARNAPGINPDQFITPGRTVAQAQADIAAQTAAILAQYGLSTTNVGQTYNVAGPAGQNILKKIEALFAGLGGGFSMPDLLRALGIKTLPGGGLSYTPPSGGLPVLNGPGGDPAAVAAAIASKVYNFPQTQNLGQLAASFGGTQVTPGGQDGTAERLRQLERANVELQKQNASLQQQLAQYGTLEGLQRAANHILDLSRGSLETLVQRIPSRPSPRTQPIPILGPS